VQRGELSHFHAISSFVPSAARQEENRELVARSLLADPARVERAFGNLGFRDGTAAAFMSAYDKGAARVLGPEEWLASPAARPFRHLWLGRTPGGFATIVLPYGHSRSSALEGAAAGMAGVTLVDKAASVSRMFGEYRAGFSLGLAAAALVVLVLLARRYGLRGGVAVILPTLLGIAAALGLSGYCGAPITLFSVMALVLVLGVGVNYSIFLVEGAGREGATLIAVLLSAATTLLSFGLLAFSDTPALARFGETLLAGISTAVLLSPLALCLSRTPAPRESSSRG
jgi:predicted exporter